MPKNFNAAEVRDEIQDLLEHLRGRLRQLSVHAEPDESETYRRGVTEGLFAGIESLADCWSCELPADHVVASEPGLYWLKDIIARYTDNATKLDGKSYGVVFSEKGGEMRDPQNYVVFLTRDKCFLPTLKFYYAECVKQGCAKPQLDAVDELIRRVIARQNETPEQEKLPDVDPGELSWERP